MGDSIEETARTIHGIFGELHNEVRVAEAIAGRRWDQLEALVDKFVELKRKLKMQFVEGGSVASIADQEVRKTIRGILAGDEPMWVGLVRSYLKRDGCTDKEIAEALSDVADPTWDEVDSALFTWFGPHEYIERLYRIGVVVLDAGPIPSYLGQYVNEARSAYAFQLDLALVCLTRAILEICLHDIARRLWERENGSSLPETVMRSEVSVIRDRINVVCERTPGLKSEVHRLLSDLHPFAHGNIFGKRPGPEQLFKKTLEAVHEMYALHEGTG